MSLVKTQSKVRVSYCCPKCSEELTRINKRSIDKLVNVIVSVRRFKCYCCLWEGTRMNLEN